MQPNQYYKTNSENVRVHIVLPKSLVQKLDRISQSLYIGNSRSLIIRQLLTEAIKRREVRKQGKGIQNNLPIENLSDDLQADEDSASRLIEFLVNAKYDQIDENAVEGV